jgi:hypothetical protein
MLNTLGRGDRETERDRDREREEEEETLNRQTHGDVVIVSRRAEKIRGY